MRASAARIDANSIDRGSSSRREWSVRYANGLVFVDVLVILGAVFGSQIIWFGTEESRVAVTGRFGDLALNYTAISGAISLLWIVFLAIWGTRDSRVVGIGALEYRRVVNASVMLFGLLAIVAYLFKIELARGYFITALPFGLVALLFTRVLARKYLVTRRRRGEMSSRVVLVGTADSTATVARELAAQPAAGYLVLGAFVSKSGLDFVPGSRIPILGEVDDLITGLDAIDADTVIVSSSEELPASKMRQLSWALEPGRHHLVVAPGLTDIAGPRIHTRPVAGLPLIHVETPRYNGTGRVTKRVFDLVVSSALIGALACPLLIVAMAVRLNSPGGVLFRQERVGLQGKKFAMLKFRSMVMDAEEQLEVLKTADRSEGNSIMFKMAEDPRVTSVGRVLRRFSLDELPQLFNVFKGDMSLVGPRPPLVSEVAQYEDHVNRRFLVLPGITGLWQVSGRSNLSWEDTVRLDLFYVENWSLTADLAILWRTFRAVIRKDGAF